MLLPPLSLYIHIPWCVQKCPYCDFNSHAQKSTLPENEYIACLLDDLRQDAYLAQGREIETIFFGGGTPSILSAESIDKILTGVRQIVPLAQNCEITLEANPGTLDREKYLAFTQAGINRFSIGVQSFQADKLTALGRIHDPHQAQLAAEFVGQLPIRSYNLDLMHGLPNQSIDDAMFDLKQAIELKPNHLSWYQLTIEPNTLFASKPPQLPEDDVLWDIQAKGQALLAEYGYEQYEISGYSQIGHQCQHNLNYWRFGDYLAIGCGAHGKITLANENSIIRTEKVKHPKGYMDLTQPYTLNTRDVEPDERPFEFFMNRFRLLEPCPIESFTQLTGLPLSTIQTAIEQAQHIKLLASSNSHWQVTSLGQRYLNDLLELFL